MSVSGERLARGHGAFNIATGLWPLVHMRSFELVLGPKTDRWLVRTIAGLLVGNGLVQFVAPGSQERVAQARLLGLSTAGTLLVADLYYVAIGRISRVYLVDAAIEAAWITGWTGRLPPRVGKGAP
jgi:hypothetical protein